MNVKGVCKRKWRVEVDNTRKAFFKRHLREKQEQEIRYNGGNEGLLYVGPYERVKVLFLFTPHPPGGGKGMCVPTQVWWYPNLDRPYSLHTAIKLWPVV
jgi:hypothetical protein